MALNDNEYSFYFIPIPLGIVLRTHSKTIPIWNRSNAIDYPSSICLFARALITIPHAANMMMMRIGKVFELALYGQNVSNRITIHFNRYFTRLLFIASYYCRNACKCIAAFCLIHFPNNFIHSLVSNLNCFPFVSLNLYAQQTYTTIIPITTSQISNWRQSAMAW